MAILELLLAIGRGVLWGFLTNKILEKKGYYNNWFWWGFFFGVIPCIVAALKPNISQVNTEYDYSENLEFLKGNHPNVEKSKQTQIANSWRCENCRAVNPLYVGTCVCGTSRSESEDIIRKRKEKLNAHYERQENNNGQAESTNYSNSYEKSPVNTTDSANTIKISSNNSYESENIKTFDTYSSEYTDAENIIINIMSKYPEGTSALTITKMVPKKIAPKDVSEGFKHLIQIGVIVKNDEGNYILNL